MSVCHSCYGEPCRCARVGWAVKPILCVVCGGSPPGEALRRCVCDDVAPTRNGRTMPVAPRSRTAAEYNHTRPQCIQGEALVHDQRQRVAPRGEVTSLAVGRGVPLASSPGIVCVVLYPQMTAKGLAQFAKACRSLRVSFTPGEGKSPCKLLPPPTDGVSAWEAFGTTDAINHIRGMWFVVNSHERVKIVDGATVRRERADGTWLENA